jgi:hypothetical protein
VSQAGKIAFRYVFQNTALGEYLTESKFQPLADLAGSIFRFPQFEEVDKKFCSPGESNNSDTYQQYEKDLTCNRQHEQPPIKLPLNPALAPAHDAGLTYYLKVANEA